MGELTHWQASNPLRKWREQFKCTQGQLAVMLGVSTNTIRAWELGYSEPHRSNKSRITAITHGHVATLEWAKWYDQKPSVQHA